MNQTKERTSLVLSREGQTDRFNYGYFIGKSRYSVHKLKAALYSSPLNPLIIVDSDRQNAVYVKVLASEVEAFVKIIKEFEFKKVKLGKEGLTEVKWAFGDSWSSLHSGPRTPNREYPKTFPW